MAKRVGAHAFGDLGLGSGLLDGPLQAGLVDVMSPDGTGARVLGEADGREHVLPAPLSRSGGVFSLQSRPDVDATQARPDIGLEELPQPTQVLVKSLRVLLG